MHGVAGAFRLEHVSVGMMRNYTYMNDGVSCHSTKPFFHVKCIVLTSYSEWSQTVEKKPHGHLNAIAGTGLG